MLERDANVLVAPRYTSAARTGWHPAQNAGFANFFRYKLLLRVWPYDIILISLVISPVFAYTQVKPPKELIARVASASSLSPTERR